MLKKYNVNFYKLCYIFCYELVKKGIDIVIVVELVGYFDVNVIK